MSPGASLSAQETDDLLRSVFGFASAPNGADDDGEPEEMAGAAEPVETDTFELFVPLRGSKIISKKQLNAGDPTYGGAMNKGVYKVLLEGGGAAFQKYVNTKQGQSAEILVSVVGRAIDAPVGDTIAGDGLSIISALLPGLTGAQWRERLKQRERPKPAPQAVVNRAGGLAGWANQQAAKHKKGDDNSAIVVGKVPDNASKTLWDMRDDPQVLRLLVCDILTNNGDRHPGNWMMDRDGHVWGFDHELAFSGGWGMDQRLSKSELLSMSRWLLSLRPRLEATLPQFKERRQTKWHRDVMERYDHMLERLQASK